MSAQPINDDVLLTIDDIVRQTKTSKTTVRAWIKSGRLPASRLVGARGSRGTLRIHPAHLKAFLEKTQVVS